MAEKITDDFLHPENGLSIDEKKLASPEGLGTDVIDPPRDFTKGEQRPLAYDEVHPMLVNPQSPLASR